MSTDREVTRIVRSWLEEGVTALPDRVLDAVLDQVPATRQRRAWWPARRFAQMSTFAKIAMAAAAVVALAVIGLNVMPRNGTVGGVGGPVATPTPTATPSPIAIAHRDAAARRRMRSLSAPAPTTSPMPPVPGKSMRSVLTFTVPAGWSTADFAVQEPRSAESVLRRVGRHPRLHRRVPLGHAGQRRDDDRRPDRPRFRHSAVARRRRPTPRSAATGQADRVDRTCQSRRVEMYEWESSVLAGARPGSVKRFVLQSARQCRRRLRSRRRRQAPRRGRQVLPGQLGGRQG